ncbi:rho guanine nucleotide exchange factor 18 isoform X2 [Oryzias melastigma]|nr:rho guanine nucleotide exchange factor 18 isoform X2 [Oryzias melastigma]XP_024135062.1 rho guanine nucleotide exchange factor 18 isoform X2 [Oryzias melastigma]
MEGGSSVEDLLNLSFSLRGSEFFKDLEGDSSPAADPRESEDADSPAVNKPSASSLTTGFSPVNAPSFPSFQQPAQELPFNFVVPHFIPDSSLTAAAAHPSLKTDVPLEIEEAGRKITQLEERKDRPAMDSDGELDLDSFPILVRSMSTSRRHSWGVPLSPINSGRRLSLDTMAINSDEEREDDEEPMLFQSTQEQPDSCSPCPEEERHGCSPGTACVAGRQLYSRSDILATDDSSRTAHISRVVRGSKQAARAAGVSEECDPEENLQSSEGQSHIAKHRSNKADSKVSGNVTWYEFLENEEEEDRPEKTEKGTKVKRKLSSLRNRMAGSFNKDKGKNREKEHQRAKERDREVKEKVRSSNGHVLMTGSFSSCATCSLCSKTLQKKHGLQCMNCAVNVHKNCKSLLGECTSSKSKKDSGLKAGLSGSPRLALRDRDREKDQAGPGASQALDGHRGFPGAPGMTVGLLGPSSQLSAVQFSCSSSSSTCSLPQHANSGSLSGEMDETDAFRIKRCNEDVISLAPSTTESIFDEDAHFAAVRADLELDAQDLEAESWSSAVDQQYLKKHSKDTVKRQDVIYELMQTEMHHVRTLKIMLRVYVRELRENLQMDSSRLDCLFPRLENLLDLHARFLSRLKERRRENLVSPSNKNYVINRVADILITQFSGEVGEKMKDSYGDFCSHHTEAVGYYKDQLQNNRRFQNTIRKISNLSIVRRLGVTECILLVTQRITKYPVLVERILQYTEGGTEEHEDLTRALGLIKDAIVQVDSMVNLYEKNSRLRDIHNKIEPKALGKIKGGRVFRREDLAVGRRRLLHEGTVSWKAASGRLKDILAVLLSDVLLLLQEKDQRYVFATVDNKPSVISLQKLIVREVAHEEKAMFLICASSNEPEMYEIHTTSKEERNSWITFIRQAVESCPHTEERLFSEEEEARASRLKEFQERLSQKDAVIVQALTEKLQLFVEMSESVSGLEDSALRSRLLLRGDTSDLQQGEALLKAAITEVENLQNLLQSEKREEAQPPRTEEGGGSGLLPRRADTFGGYDSISSIQNGIVKKNSPGESRCRDRSQRASSDPQLKEICGKHSLQQTVEESRASPARRSWMWSKAFPKTELIGSVLMLSQSLYSLQAIISQQDSHIELQRASLTERASMPNRHRGNVLLEQEKQRTLALQREELATLHKLQSQHRQEQQRWEKERERHRQQVEATEARLLQREEECRRLEEHLAKEKEELDRQRETYQQDLERLRESTRTVEKERERLENLRKTKRKTIEVAPLSGSLNGELLSSLSSSSIDSQISHKPLVRGSLSVAPADYAERPEVTVRREAGSSGLPLKTEVPLHLFSTTNQLHKAVGVQQQIPTKLAAINSGKGKGGKTGKATHRTDSSSSADMKQMLPLKLSAREESAVKAKRSISPHQPLATHHHTDPSMPADGSGVDPPPASYPPNLQKHLAHSQPSMHAAAVTSQSSGSLQFQPSVQLQNFNPNAPGAAPLPGLGHAAPPPYAVATEELSKEDVIFF